MQIVPENCLKGLFISRYISYARYMTISESTPEIDFNFLKQYIGDDIELTKEVFGLFKHQIDMWKKGLNATADDETWASVMHSLKGSARAVGATRLAQLCETGENMVGNLGGIATREAHVQDVSFSIDRALIEIGRWEYRQTLASMRS